MFERGGFIIILVLFFGGILFFQFGFPYEGRAKMEDDYPNRPVQIVVTWSAGHSIDVTSRFLAPYLSEYFKQPFIVINKPGAGGVIGHTLIAKSKPDGYTLGAVSTLFGVYLLTVKDLEFDLESFVPVCGYAKVPGYFLVRNDAPWKTMKEFVGDAMKNPGKLSYSTQGVGSAAHLLAVEFFNRAGIKVTHIPYSGAAEALTALIGGHVGMGVTWASAGHLKGGTLRALAVAEKERLEDFPNVPTLTELGYPITIQSISGHVAPKGTPQKIMEKLTRGYLEILRANKAAVAESFQKLELYPIVMTPNEYYKQMTEDYKYMYKTFQGIKLK